MQAQHSLATVSAKARYWGDCTYKLGPSFIDNGGSLQIRHRNSLDNTIWTFDSRVSNYVLSDQDQIVFTPAAVEPGARPWFTTQLGHVINPAQAIYHDFTSALDCGGLKLDAGSLNVDIPIVLPGPSSSRPAASSTFVISSGSGTVSSQGGKFSVTASNSAGTITTATSVSSGTAVQTDNQGVSTVLSPGQTGSTSAPAPLIYASVLPNSRSIQQGATATAFASILNAGNCRSRVQTCLASGARRELFIPNN